MKLLVTGAAGFIGFHTAAALASQGHELVLADNYSRHGRSSGFRSLATSPKVRLHELDLCDPQAWAQLGGDFDAVFHFAAINGTRHFYERPFEVLDINMQLMRMCLAWHRQHSPRAHIVFTSSSEVYAGVAGLQLPTPEETPVGIDDVTNPRYSYSVSKLVGELLLISYARSTKAPWTIVRPHNIYGPGMGYDHVIPQFIARAIRREDPFRIFGADTTRTFCYIDDFVRGVTAILGSPQAVGQLIHLGNESDELTMLQLANRLFAVLGWQPAVELHPAPAGSTPRRCPSIAKARRILGFAPSVGLDRGLKLTYDWYQHNAEPQIEKAS
jgi:nucleoside-diphosphate-sugar epimerase